MRVMLDAEAATRGLRRLAGEIVERHAGADDLVLVGVRRGGVPVAREIARWVKELEGRDLPMGTVDITLYRDDAATALPNPRIGPSEIPFALEGKHVILVDDVVFTGRTVRAAIDALMDYGRPKRVELAALVDRGGRELPIQPDYVVATVSLEAEDRVDVLDDALGLRAIVHSTGARSVPPSFI
ncbi:MAG: bifunctional pyr operon transcriptional regulator/uracil phosphoribosyltransferase PyrR [Myxococcales bacterium]|nr:bifunctional pyr operon transcriptional regulator/uracil phosphoribosyltransferase PyrR [Myxococcales bacterium]MCB9577227.1 bifunctional pyr operon transcriptional regulator/uracil phosphoribosyltransferase PyrR [Polyangiaceae bacterium]